jgi:hypothetical protein
MKEPKYKVAYIIGAGASMPYEMPSGSELKEKILTSLRGMQQKIFANFCE